MKEQNLKLQIRILLEQNIAFGPGKADLLEAIARTGSISQAAKSMNMSYRRAWQLVDTMNQCFETALVETQTGGTHGVGQLSQLWARKSYSITVKWKSMPDKL
ncbi:transcriptional regulator modE [Acinetobacter baumannii ABNIH10]|nr:transcriptional regulator modE [Acinetobacter baumannii ABNIH10]